MALHCAGMPDFECVAPRNVRPAANRALPMGNLDNADPIVETLWLLGGLVLGMLLMLPRLHDASRGQRDGLMMLVLASIGLCGISLGSGSLIIAELSLAITASLAGLWVWSVCGGITFKGSMMLAGVGTLLPLAASQTVNNVSAIASATGSAA